MFNALQCTPTKPRVIFTLDCHLAIFFITSSLVFCGLRLCEVHELVGWEIEIPEGRIFAELGDFPINLLLIQLELICLSRIISNCSSLRLSVPRH